jgi:hypothetical protein
LTVSFVTKGGGIGDTHQILFADPGRLLLL